MKRIHFFIFLAVAAGFVAGCVPLSRWRPDHDIRIRLYRPEAKKVSFLSSLNRYAPISMKRTLSGVWEIRAPGDKGFDYFFDVDGNSYIPDCQLQQQDDWGGRQCIYSPEIQEL